MFEQEENHWWYKGLHDLLFSEVEEILNGKDNAVILDAGCGTGFTLQCLNKYGKAFGIDLSNTAIEYCRKRGLNQIVRSSICNLPFPDELFDIIISTDVLYHKAVSNDFGAIRELYRVLKNGGFLIVNLPAHNYIRRTHDERVHTRHRYSRRDLSDKLQKLNFKIVKISYRNSFLFPLFYLLSLNSRRTNKKIDSDLKHNIRILDFILFSLLKIENKLIRKINLSVGTSIFCIAQK